MPIPDYQTIMLPLMQFIVDGKEHSIQEAVGHLTKFFDLSDVEQKVLLPSGKQTKFVNRVGWARTYLKKAGLLNSPARSKIIITQRGQELLSKKPDRIGEKLLMQYPEFVSFQTKRSEKSPEYQSGSSSLGETSDTPSELMGNAYNELRAALAGELLEKVKGCSPSFFESLVVELLVKMGYGGSIQEAGKVIGKSGDGGIDGVIKEDRLGLDLIYIQAKRWEGNVGRPLVQAFAGALQGERAKKGIMLTTSSFTKDAIEFAKTIENKIVLIDGEQLVEYMIDHDLGVSKISSYEIKRLDSDYFSDE